jgi:23S rRNA (uracil1939-C5)-methyltransferase
LISVTDCKLVTPSLSGALPMVETLAKAGASRKYELSVMVTDTQTGLDVFVGGGKPLDTKLQFDLAEIARSYDLARITWSDEIAVQRRVPLVDFDGISVPLPPGAFLQATLAGEEALRRFVLDNLKGATHVLDLFSGCGTFSLPLSQQARVHAVENDAGMLNALDQGWRHGNGLKQVTTEQRDLFRNPVLPSELKRFDAVVLDPPRAGAAAQVKQLGESNTNRIVYVSCNPATFARDASQLLLSGYKMSPIQIVDQFRWSSHVELCASFHRN